MSDTIVNRNNAAAFIAGSLLGVGVALLLAPQSGRKTRRDLGRFAEKAKNRVGAAQIEVRHFVDNVIGDAAESIKQGLSRGIDWTDDKISDLKCALDSGRTSICAEIEKIQSSNRSE